MNIDANHVETYLLAYIKATECEAYGSIPVNFRHMGFNNLGFDSAWRREFARSIRSEFHVSVEFDGDTNLVELHKIIMTAVGRK